MTLCYLLNPPILLDGLKVYCDKWNITVNTEKTKVVVFKSGNRRSNVELYFDNIRLEQVTSFTYLGVTLASNGNFFQTQKSLAEQANKALYSLNKLFDKVQLNITEKIKLFDSMILPILNYGCEVWGFHPAPNIEALHLKFLKQILMVKPQTSSAAIYGELGRVPLIVKRKERILRYWFKLKNSSDIVLSNAYLNEFHIVDQDSGPFRIKYWASELKSMLNDLGFSYLWNIDTITNIQLQKVIERLYDQYLQKWFGELSTMSKLSTYNVFKSEFVLEKYLTCITNEKHRIALTRLRCSAHNLEIEVGRYHYNRTDRQNRLCKLCNMNMVENEYHFVLVCPFYNDLRRQYLPSHYCRWPSKNKFINLLKDCQTSIIKRVSKFVYLAMEKRKNMLDINL